MPDTVLMVSCEHASNRVPREFAGYFAGSEAVLESHRGYDPGASELAAAFATAFDAPCYQAQITRLLIDHNRSPDKRTLWSAYSRSLSSGEKRQLLEGYYRPFRQSVASAIAAAVAVGRRTVHLSVHSFAPELAGRQRTMEVGLLYDPSRRAEAELACRWQTELLARRPGWRVRRNAPYRGRSDCHQSDSRNRYQPATYLAIELEINQKLLVEPEWPAMRADLVTSLRQVIGF